MCNFLKYLPLYCYSLYNSATELEYSPMLVLKERQAVITINNIQNKMYNMCRDKINKYNKCICVK